MGRQNNCLASAMYICNELNRILCIKACRILAFISLIRYNIVHPAVDLPKNVLWDIINFLMNPVRHCIEDDHSLDRVTFNHTQLMLAASSEASMVDSAMTDSELSLVSEIMFDQHDKLSARMETVEETVGQFLCGHVASPVIRVSNV